MNSDHKHDTRSTDHALRSSTLVWHYTTGECLRQILDSGEIRVATAGVEMELDTAKLWRSF